MRNNVSLNVEDYKNKRKGGANSYALAISIKGLETIELVQIFVDMIAEKHPNKQFSIHYDGIYTVVVKYDDKIIYDGNVVEIENMLQKGTYVFRDKILTNVK